tara:strand:+ start:367 stop:636 length:270 start_codon:yes stop_codon:yes gene_type:complete
MSNNYFKLLTYVKHKEQGIEGLVISSPTEKCSHVTIYDPNCPNDDDFPEESYGFGSALTFNNSELKHIENPSSQLVNQCKDVIKLLNNS